MHRRDFLFATGALALAVRGAGSKAKAARRTRASNLLNAPIEVAGDWGDASGNDARTVLGRARKACLSNVSLISDRQPKRLRVEERSSGRPHIWLHEDQPQTAWIVVDIAALHWAQLAYQFGHELGHVLCNSWLHDANLEPPTRWLEEAMAEAFSVRGLGLLADSWQRRPPFPNNSAYANSLRKYRGDLLVKYHPDGDPPATGVATWFRENRTYLEKAHGVGPAEGPAIVAIATLLQNDPDCVSDMGAVNRWPERSAVPIERYLTLWQESCGELDSPGVLPRRIRQLFGVT